MVEVDGVAFSSHLAERRVSERMAEACARVLGGRGSPPHRARGGLGRPPSRRQPGGVGALRQRLRPGGRPRRGSEAIGRSVAAQLLEDLATGAAVDRHLADMLVIFAALARGRSCYRAPSASEHLRTNLWLAERLGARVALEGTRASIEGIGLVRR